VIDSEPGFAVTPAAKLVIDRAIQRKVTEIMDPLVGRALSAVSKPVALAHRCLRGVHHSGYPVSVPAKMMAHDVRMLGGMTKIKDRRPLLRYVL